MIKTVPFTYKDGPLVGVHYTCHVVEPEQIGKEATLHQCSRKSLTSKTFTEHAQGMYVLSLDEEGKAVAIHIPSDQDRWFGVEPVTKEPVS